MSFSKSSLLNQGLEPSEFDSCHYLSEEGFGCIDASMQVNAF